ncbi:hypothetical protein SmJEL517_g01758 [Synchytrium microbalum]|uniref:Dynein regulatory complex subunit 3 n=1 Tax=Synchytrium microbalum TaxID=1806994 RepID=A0A507CA22_9FUNG|nr:uncharacterized protein SmJEL517_g01758 [Synchytrium microbalum]TPX36019.1 hypothetical protein SmJEL517_g01758 [Synchytrium microbalum]
MNYSSTEPTVIDEDLLSKGVDQQLPAEISVLTKEEGIDPEDVTSLQLDYKNILKIDNLWRFKNLTKLQLDNNIIEKIENLGFLKNLTWLDLSFNNIAVIEGLEELTKLTDLTLYNNRITEVKGLDTLTQLNVLSLGNNAISGVDAIEYLRRFENLRVLNLAGNPLCKIQDYRPYILARLRNLRYLDYRLADEEQMKEARSKYMDNIIAMEEEERIATEKKLIATKSQQEGAKFAEAHIPGFDKLFDSIFNEDKDFVRLLPLDTDRISDIREQYRVKFDVAVNELIHFVMKRHLERVNEIDGFKYAIEDARAPGDEEATKELDRFMRGKKQVLKMVASLREQSEIDDALRTLRDEGTRLSDLMMRAEMQLVEQLEDVIKEFERAYTELASGISEFATTCFARLREYETEFHERFTEAVSAAYDRYTKGEVVDDVDDDFRDLISDKDSLTNSVNASHDFRLARIDQQEDTLVSGSAKDTEQVISGVHDEEIRRNRKRVIEIISFLGRLQQEIEAVEDSAY